MSKKKYVIILILTFLPYIYLIFHLIKCYFFGFEVTMMSGLDIFPSYGFEAIGNFLWYFFSFYTFGFITVPLIIACFVYQIVYFFRLRKSYRGGDNNARKA